MAVVAWILLGLAGGAIGRATYFGSGASERALQVYVTGVVGAVLGGLVALAIGWGSAGSFFNPAAWVAAISGSLLLVAIYSAVVERGSHRGQGA